MSLETIPTNRRIYLIFEPGNAGRTALRLSFSPPPIGNAQAALIVRGMIMDGSVLDVDLVTDPTLDPDLRGLNGWTPVLAGEADGTRTLLKVADWYGGKGEKPALGYIGAAGATSLVAKAAAFNFNAIKRVDIFSGATAAGGVAAIVFDPPFTSIPAKALPQAVPNVLAGPVKAELVAGSMTKAGCQVKVTSAALLTGVVSALVGASVTVIAIEA